MVEGEGNEISYVNLFHSSKACFEIPKVKSAVDCSKWIDLMFRT